MIKRKFIFSLLFKLLRGNYWVSLQTINSHSIANELYALNYLHSPTLYQVLICTLFLFGSQFMLWSSLCLTDSGAQTSQLSRYVKGQSSCQLSLMSSVVCGISTFAMYMFTKEGETLFSVPPIAHKGICLAAATHSRKRQISVYNAEQSHLALCFLDS